MKIEWNKRYLAIAKYAILTLTAVVLIVFLLLRFDAIRGFFSSILSAGKPLVYAIGIAYLLCPLMRTLENKVFHFIEKKKPHKRLVRILSLICTYIILLLALALIFGTVIPQIIDSMTTLKNKLTGYASGIEAWFNRLFIDPPEGDSHMPEWLVGFVREQAGKLQDYVDRAINWVSENLSEILTKAASYTSFFTDFAVEVKNILLGIIFAIYFLLFKENLLAQAKKFFHAILSDDHYERAAHYFKLTDHTFGGFITGKLLDSLLIGLLCFIFMMIFRMPYAPLISMVIGITNVIPFFGPFIGAIPSAFIVLIAEPRMTLWFILLVFLLQQLDGNVIGPKILGDFVGLSPLWIIVAITLMGGLFGVFGMFFGVPTFAVFYAIVKELIEKKLEKKSLPTVTDEYYASPDYLEVVHPRKKEHTLGDTVKETVGKRIPKKIKGTFRKKK